MAFRKEPNRVSVLEPDQVGHSSTVERNRDYGNAIVDRNPTPEFKLPGIHNTHIERYWPRYLGLVAAVFAASYYISDGKTDPFNIAFPSVLFGLFVFWVSRSFRGSLNSLYFLRKPGKRSKAFYAGAGVGLLFWIYMTFSAPLSAPEFSLGYQSVFSDGIQRQDLGILAVMLLKAGVYAFVGGTMFEFVNRSIRSKAR